MAATYTAVTLEEIETFLRRAFRALKPKKDSERGEIVFWLNLSQNAGIKVMTSISHRGDTGAGVGEDAIRVILYSFKKGRPLISGKAPIVKRTQGWRDSLKDRIENAIEMYESKEEDIEAGRFVNWND